MPGLILREDLLFSLALLTTPIKTAAVAMLNITPEITQNISSELLRSEMYRNKFFHYIHNHLVIFDIMQRSASLDLINLISIWFFYDILVSSLSRVVSE